MPSTNLALVVLKRVALGRIAVINTGERVVHLDCER
jgi:hypothetical protein